MSEILELRRAFKDAYSIEELTDSQDRVLRQVAAVKPYGTIVLVAGLMSGTLKGVPPLDAPADAPVDTGGDQNDEPDGETFPPPTGSPAGDAVAESAPELIVDSAIPESLHDELLADGLVTIEDVKAVDDLTTINGIGPVGAEKINAAITD